MIQCQKRERIVITMMNHSQMFKLALMGMFLFNILNCGTGSHQLRIPDGPPDDMRPVPKPEDRKFHKIQDDLEKALLVPSTRFFDLARHGRKISGKPRQALNVNAFDEVYNSSWFTNRNASDRLTLNEIARGANIGSGPDTSDIWQIFKVATERLMPQISVMDKHGSRYVITFDPAGYAEMATGAAIISSKFFYAAGYNVPEFHLVVFNPHILKVQKDVEFVDAKGERHFLNRDNVITLLSGIEQRRDGLVRAVARKVLPGQPVGPFQYIGVRKDDLNDVIPHEHRRELRGLKIMAAWLNLFDVKASNTTDIYNDAGYVKHYLLNFSGTLGSGVAHPQLPEAGREGATDLAQMGKLLGSLGIYNRPWEQNPDTQFQSVGNFTAKNFRPDHYKYGQQNPAFGNATNRDNFWGTKLVMSFTPKQIREVVEQGRYAHPEVTEYLIQTLLERQKIVGQTFWHDVNTLDNFKINENSRAEPVLLFTDLAVKAGIEQESKSEYRFSVHQNGAAIIANRSLNDSTLINLSTLVQESKSKPGQIDKEIYWEIKLQIRRSQTGKWIKPVRVYLAKEENDMTFNLQGVKR